MKAVIQRVKKTTLSVDGELISEIPFGLAVYFGVGKGDTKDMAIKLAQKLPKLRIFEDENGKMNRSVQDVGGEILFISQFTLYGDTSHGNRPSFTMAEDPTIAKEMYEFCAEKIRESGVPVKMGVFGADMKIEQFNDGPITILMEF